MLKLMGIFLVAAALAGCAAYGPAVGYGVGYSEKDLGDGSVKVTFRGDINISKEATVKYWLHRCAELTVQRGFTYFALLPDVGAPRSGAPGLPYDVTPGELRRLGMIDPEGMVTVRGGGAPIIIFTPGSPGGTYWTKSGVVRLFRTRVGLSDDQVYSLHAPTVLQMLKPLIDTAKEAGTPEVRDIVGEAMKAGQPVTSPVLRRL